jgi:arylsulfatase A-like enzyme
MPASTAELPVYRPRDEERAAPPARRTPCATRDLVALTVWFGLASGLLELGILLLRRVLESTAVLGAQHLNRHFLWMIPLGQLALFLAAGLPLAALARYRPSAARRMAILVLTALALFALLKMIPGLRSVAAAALAVGVAYQLSAWLAAREPFLQRIVRVSTPILLGIVLILGAVSYDRVVLAERRALDLLPAAKVGAPNVLLVVLDTVRADHLSLYGYSRQTSPNLDRLARRGVVFTEARSTAPWTLPAHASLFTGRWPHETGAAENHPLNDKLPTLAEHLAAQGYKTAGFVANTYFCNSWYGLARGFAHYEDYFAENLVISPGEILRATTLGRWLTKLAHAPGRALARPITNLKDAEHVNADFLRWLADNRDRPFFVFLNYFDAHDPYQPPPGYDRHFGLKPETPQDIETLRKWHHERQDVTPHEKQLLIDAYDDCLGYLDEQLGKLFDELERQGILKDTYVVIVSDHGEDLGERGLYGHGKTLYRPEIRVPLILVGPSGVPAGVSVSDPVSLREVAATIVDRLELPTSSPFPGRSLARFWEQANPTVEEPILSEVHMTFPRPPIPSDGPAGQGPMASVLQNGYLYIRGPKDREELYDLTTDPDEHHDLAGAVSARSLLEPLRQELDRLTRPGD